MGACDQKCSVALQVVKATDVLVEFTPAVYFLNVRSFPVNGDFRSSSVTEAGLGWLEMVARFGLKVAF
jgi:hypothetical protein